MKARLLCHQDKLELLLCTGKIKSVSLSESRKFLLNFDSPTYYSDEGHWDYKNLTMESYHGTTIAIVDDEGILQVKDAIRYREIIDHASARYLTVQEYAILHGKQPAIVRRMCLNNRIDGAIYKGKTWLIPEDSPYPADERIRKP